MWSRPGSLLSAVGVRFIITGFILNFTGFAAIGLLVAAMIGPAWRKSPAWSTR